MFPKRVLKIIDVANLVPQHSYLDPLEPNPGFCVWDETPSIKVSGNQLHIFSPHLPFFFLFVEEREKKCAGTHLNVGWIWDGLSRTMPLSPLLVYDSPVTKPPDEEPKTLNSFRRRLNSFKRSGCSKLKGLVCWENHRGERERNRPPPSPEAIKARVCSKARGVETFLKVKDVTTKGWVAPLLGPVQRDTSSINSQSIVLQMYIWIDQFVWVFTHKSVWRTFNWTQSINISGGHKDTHTHTEGVRQRIKCVELLPQARFPITSVCVRASVC